MKKLLMVLFTIALCAGFTACSSNDDNEPSIADKVAGVYIGQTAASFQYSPKPDLTDGDSIIVTKATDNTVNIEYRSTKWGKGVFKNVHVSETNEAYTLAETTSKVAVPSMKQPGKITEYPAKIKGNVAKVNKGATSFSKGNVAKVNKGATSFSKGNVAKVNKGATSFSIDIPGVMNGVKITFTPKTK